MTKKRKSGTKVITNTGLALALLSSGMTAMSYQKVANAAGETVQKISDTDIRATENNFVLSPTAGKTVKPVYSPTGVAETFTIADNAPNGPGGAQFPNGYQYNKSAISQYAYDQFQDGYGAKTYFINKADLDKASIDVLYKGQAIYKGEVVDVKVTYDNFKWADASEVTDFKDQSVIQLSDNLYSGFVTNNLKSLTMNVEFIKADGSKVMMDGDTFFTFNSISGEKEFVDYTNAPAGTVVNLTQDTNITEQTYNGQDVFAAASNNFNDSIGASNFKRNSVSYQVKGDSLDFDLGTIDGNSMWASISSSTLFKTFAPAPKKTVEGETADNFDRTEVLNYAIPQKVQTLGVDALVRYTSWSVTDPLDKDGVYVPNSAKLVDDKGNDVAGAGVFNYDATAHTLTFTANPGFLETMPLMGETYYVELQMTAKDGIAEGTTIENTASSNIDGNIQKTNTVVSTLNADPKPNTPPVITADDMKITVGQPFDPMVGVVGMDNEDGTVTVTVKQNNVDTSKPGTYTVVYEATDSKDEPGTKTRTVVVEDVPNTPPVITASDVSIKVGETFTPKTGVKATDAEDTNPPVITVISNNVDESKAGTYTVVYEAKDSKDAKSQVTQKVIVSENPNTAPVVKADDRTITVGDAFDPLKGVTAVDAEDGNVISNIKVDGIVDNMKPGTYVLTYTANDSKDMTGTDTATITVKGVPVITAPPVKVTVGDNYDPKANVEAVDSEDGKLEVVIKESNVDLTKPGTYQETITATDKDGNTSVQTREVVVEGKKTNEKPNIIVNDEYVLEGSDFDPLDNVWAIDKEDVDLTGQVTVKSGYVDTKVPGKYDITYTVTDSDKNVRDRTVTYTVGKDYQKAIDSLTSITDSLTNQLKDHEDRIKALENQVAKNTGDIADLKNQIAEQQKAIDALKDRIDAQQAQIDALKAQTDKNTADIAALQKNVDQLQKDVKDLQDRVTVLEKQVAQNTSDIKSLNDRVTVLEDKEKALEDRLTVLEGKVDKNTKDIEALQKELADIKKEIADLKAQVDELKNSVKDLQDADKAILDKIKELEDKIKALEKKASGISIQINNTNTNNNTGTKASDDNKDDSDDKDDTDNTGDNTKDDNKSDDVTTPTKDDNQPPASGTNATGSNSNGSTSTTTQPSSTTSGQTSNVSKPQQTQTSGILPDTGSFWSNLLTYGGASVLLLGIALYMRFERKTKEE